MKKIIHKFKWKNKVGAALNVSSGNEKCLMAFVNLNRFFFMVITKNLFSKWILIEIEMFKSHPIHL